jgi:hypothetical protein
MNGTSGELKGEKYLMLGNMLACPFVEVAKTRSSD